jgi:Galactose oxidase, central domain
MIVFGGNNCGSTYYNDVWVLMNANGLSGTPTWSRLSPTGTPPAVRAYTSAVYDPNTNRLIVFGGYNRSILGDLWVLTNANGTAGSPQWIQLTPSGSAPSNRYGHSAVYDAANNRMIVYGGTTGGTTILSDTWVLSNANGLGGSPAWTLTVAGTGSAPARSLHNALYDPASNKMIIFGGKPQSQLGIVSDDHINVLNDANGL